MINNKESVNKYRIGEAVAQS